MPARNSRKQYGEDEYYHVYNRGVDRLTIFREPSDYDYFRRLLARFLSPTLTRDDSGHKSRNYSRQLDLLAYCLMPNHFHMLIHLRDSHGIKQFMQSIMTAYSMYYNKKYQRSGSLFQGRYLASQVTQEYYLWHVSRYIHLNPIDIGRQFDTYPYSSIRNFEGLQSDDWLRETLLVENIHERTEYMKFVEDYETMSQDLNFLKNQLANSIPKLPN